MSESDARAGNPEADHAEDGERRPVDRIADKVYDQIENGLGQGTIAMIAFLVAMPVVVVAAHCVML